jgi:hypothetical protein
LYTDGGETSYLDRGAQNVVQTLADFRAEKLQPKGRQKNE